MSPTDVPLHSMMTATMNSEEAVPYIWSECQPPSDQVLKMWYEVGNKLDKDSTGEFQKMKNGHQWSREICGFGRVLCCDKGSLYLLPYLNRSLLN
jgi:hypothetical protein